MYTAEYDSDRIRRPRNDFVDYVVPYLTKESSLIDLGCGTCKKLIQLAKHVGKADGIDTNETVLRRGGDKIAQSTLTNIMLFSCNNFATPFRSQSYDFCTASLTLWSSAEVHRILKPNGLFFLEILCADDKKEIKQAFGKDEWGWRGRYLNQSVDERMMYIRKSMEPFFEIVDEQEVKYRTSLSVDGFVLLLNQTPTIRGFSESLDGKIIENLSEAGRISFDEHRVFIRAKRKGV